MNDSASRAYTDQQQQAMSAADAVIQGATRIFEIQATAARSFFENQGRTASMFGAPDFSALIKQPVPYAEWFNANTEQATALMRQTSETMAEVRRQMFELMQAHTTWITEQMRQNVDDFTRQTGEGLKMWRDATRQAADEAVATVQSGQQAMQSGQQAVQSGTATPSIVVSAGLEGTRSAQQRPEERGRTTVKR